MIYGIVAIRQVPMLMTFDDDDAMMVGLQLADALDRSYAVLDFFNFDNDPSEDFE